MIPQQRTCDLDTVGQLAVDAAAGSTDALGELYELYMDKVFRFVAMRVGQDQAAAEDITSEVWLRVAKSIGTWKAQPGRRDGFANWLFAIAYNATTDHHRRMGRRRENLAGDCLAVDAPAADATPDEIAERHDLSRHVATALKRLAPKQRECVTLRFYIGLSLAETAQVMTTSEGSVKMLQQRALKKLAGIIPSADRYSTYVVDVSKVNDVVDPDTV